MVVPPTTTIDSRGYAFHFPALGLPDPSNRQGEDVLIRVAIGSNKDAMRLLKDKDETHDAPRRYAGDMRDYLDLQYEGAIWILPVVAPRTKDQAELFTLKVRRVHPSMLRHPHRMRLPDCLTIFFMQPPGGIEATFHRKALKTMHATEADEAQFWGKDWVQVLNRRLEELATTGGRGEKQAIKVMPPPGALEEKFDPYAAVKDEWEKAVIGVAVSERIKATGIIPRKDPNIVIRGGFGSQVEIKYTLDWQKVDPLTIPEEEWKIVPPYAYKPGAELKLVNQVRKAVGRELITQEQLERVHLVVAAQAKSDARRGK